MLWQFVCFAWEKSEEVMEMGFGLGPENEQTQSGSGRPVQVAEGVEIK